MVASSTIALLLLPPISTFGLRRGNSTRKANQQGICDPWEVCKCVGGWDDASTTCRSDSCTYAPSSPPWCCSGGLLCDDPECKQIKDWSDCEWANWNEHDGAEWDEPGASLFTDVPLGPGPRSRSDGFVVMMDVDDTMKCSGGPPGGADETCLGTEVHEMYPGVGEFALALARGAEDIMKPRKVTPLSARPSELRAFLAMKPGSMEDNTFRLAGEAVGVQGFGLDTDSAQYGSLFDLTDIVYLPGTKPTRFNNFGYRKYSNWKKISTRFGKAFAFIGDNGQGDAVAAQMMLKRSEGLTDEQGALRVAFIHDVKRSCTSATCRSSFARLGVHLFEHYAHAAGLAASAGLISAKSCRAVCAAAPMLPCSCP